MGSKLRDIWAAEIKKQDPNDGPGKIEALSWLSRTTLDVIGLAGLCNFNREFWFDISSAHLLFPPGFNYNFHALTDDPEMNELSKAFSILFKVGTKIDVIGLLRGLFPVMRFLVRGDSDLMNPLLFSLNVVGVVVMIARRPGRRSQTGQKNHVSHW